MRLIPGDPALAILSDGDGSYTQQDLDRLRHEMGTDRPLTTQYVDWMGGVLQGDFGDSLWFRAPVMTELKQRIPRTLELAVLAIVMAVGLSVPLGIISYQIPDIFPIIEQDTKKSAPMKGHIKGQSGILPSKKPGQ